MTRGRVLANNRQLATPVGGVRDNPVVTAVGILASHPTSPEKNMSWLCVLHTSQGNDGDGMGGWGVGLGPPRGQKSVGGDGREASDSVEQGGGEMAFLMYGLID